MPVVAGAVFAALLIGGAAMAFFLGALSMSGGSEGTRVEQVAPAPVPAAPPAPEVVVPEAPEEEEEPIEGLEELEGQGDELLEGGMEGDLVATDGDDAGEDQVDDEPAAPAPVNPELPSPEPAPVSPEPADPVVQKKEADVWGTVDPVPAQPVPAPKPRSSTVTFSSEPPGAEVRINGESMGVTPWKATLAHDNYAVAMVLEGYETQNRDVDIDNSTSAVSLTLQPNAMVTLYVEAPGRKGDMLFVDSRPVGSVPRALELKPGRYTFTLEGAEGERLTLTKEVAIGDQLLEMK